MVTWSHLKTQGKRFIMTPSADFGKWSSSSPHLCPLGSDVLWCPGQTAVLRSLWGNRTHRASEEPGCKYQSTHLLQKALPWSREKLHQAGSPAALSQLHAPEGEMRPTWWPFLPVWTEDTGCWRVPLQTACVPADDPELAVRRHVPPQESRMQY